MNKYIMRTDTRYLGRNVICFYCDEVYLPKQITEAPFTNACWFTCPECGSDDSDPAWEDPPTNWDRLRSPIVRVEEMREEVSDDAHNRLERVDAAPAPGGVSPALSDLHLEGLPDRLEP